MADHFVGLDLVGQMLLEVFPNAHCHQRVWYVECGDVMVLVDDDGGPFRVGLYRGPVPLDEEPVWLATMSSPTDVIRTVDWLTEQDWDVPVDENLPIWCRECHAFVGEGCDG